MFIVYISREMTGYKIVIDQSLALYAMYKHSPSGYTLGSHVYNIAYKSREWSCNNYILLIIIILYTYIYIQYKTDIKMKERAAQGQRST